MPRVMGRRRTRTGTRTGCLFVYSVVWKPFGWRRSEHAIGRGEGGETDGLGIGIGIGGERMMLMAVLVRRMRRTKLWKPPSINVPQTRRM